MNGGVPIDPRGAPSRPRCAGLGRVAALLAAFALSVAHADALPAGAEVRIDLRPRIDPPHDTVTLGDVANLTTRDLALLQSLMALPLGSAPRLGRATVLDRTSVKDWVMLRTGWGRSSGPSIVWGGASESLIESPTQLVTGERIAGAAHEGLTRWLAQRSTRARADLASPVRDLVLPRGEVTLRVRAPAPDAAPTSRMQVWVEAWVGDTFIRSSAVSFAVEAWASARMTTAALAQGTSLDAAVAEGEVVQREVDLARLGRRDFAAGPTAGESFAGQSSNGNLQLRRSIAAGQPVSARDLETKPAVARGQSASLDVRHGAIRVESQVEVLQDGRIGDVVRVRARAAEQPLLARVVAPGQLQMAP